MKDIIYSEKEVLDVLMFIKNVCKENMRNYRKGILRIPITIADLLLIQTVANLKDHMIGY